MTVHDLLRRLPEPAILRKRCRSFAVLDAVLEPQEPQFRYHTFIERWAPDGTALASMNNGGGDLYAIAFAPAGTFLYGFDHESPATPWRDEPRAHWPGLLDGLPEPLAHFTQEPSFLLDSFFDATVCAWREPLDSGWRCGPVDFAELLRNGEVDPDGAGNLFDLIVDGSSQAYADWAADYFEVDVDEGAVAEILAGKPLTPELVRSLHQTTNFHAVASEATSMTYPVAQT